MPESNPLPSSLIVQAIQQCGPPSAPEGYEIEGTAPIGRGWSGDVWAARSPGGMRVAIKRVKVTRDPDGSGAREIEALFGTLRHLKAGFLVVPHAFWIKDGELLIAMDLAEGSLLEAARAAPGGRIPSGALLRYMEHAAQGIDSLTRAGAVRAVHCDIKPSNLLLFQDMVRVADFGLATLIHGRDGFHCGGGTPEYIAPERIQRRLHVHSDQYSLAMTYYHLATGRHPYEAHRGSTQALLSAHLSGWPDLSGVGQDEAAVIAKALSKNPEQRWASCAVFVAELRAAREGRPRDEPSIRRRSRRALCASAAVMLLACLACLDPPWSERYANVAVTLGVVAAAWRLSPIRLSGRLSRALVWGCAAGFLLAGVGYAWLFLNFTVERDTHCYREVVGWELSPAGERYMGSNPTASVKEMLENGVEDPFTRASLAGAIMCCWGVWAAGAVSLTGCLTIKYSSGG